MHATKHICSNKKIVFRSITTNKVVLIESRIKIKPKCLEKTNFIHIQGKIETVSNSLLANTFFLFGFLKGNKSYIVLHNRLSAVSPPSSARIDEEQPVSNGEDLALAELDSVINSYHSSSSGGGTKSSGEKGKRSKRNKDVHSRGGTGGSGAESTGGNIFKSGGTWPRTRGGPIIDYGTGI